MYLIYLITAVFIGGYLFWRTKDIFHPAIIFLSMWYLTAAISCMDYASYILPWCLEMHVVVFVSGIFFFIGALFSIDKRRKHFRQLIIKRKTSKQYNHICYFLYMICFICFLLEWKANNFSLTLLQEREGELKSMNTSLSFIHYGTVLFPYIVLFIFYKIMNEKKKNKKDIILFIFPIAASLFAHVSRGELIIIIFGMLFIYSRYHYIKRKTIILSLSVSLFMFFSIMQLRVAESSVVLTTKENPYWSMIYAYTATCYANLNELIIMNTSPHLLGNITFAPLWTLLGIRDNMFRIEIDQIGIFNARTYLYGFYHDYKFFGICFFPLLFGTILTAIYNKSIYNKSPYWILLMAALQKAIYVLFFGNYLTGEFILLFPYILIFLLILLLKKTININIVTNQDYCKNYYLSNIERLF
jgi:oligosaccharide repeat unit polymerase